MNKILKWGLILQIPNILILSIILIATLVLTIDWLFLFENFGIIILMVFYGLVNIFSLIFIIGGILK
jgi:hypothetical protein